MERQKSDVPSSSEEHCFSVRLEATSFARISLTFGHNVVGSSTRILVTSLHHEKLILLRDRHLLRETTAWNSMQIVSRTR
jgi:hypothetical protein